MVLHGLDILASPPNALGTTCSSMRGGWALCVWLSDGGKVDVVDVDEDMFLVAIRSRGSLGIVIGLGVSSLECGP